MGALVAVVLALVVLFWRWWDEPPEEPWLPRHSLRGDALGCYTLLNDRVQVEPSFMDWRSIVRLDSAAGENVFHIPAAAWRRAQPLDTLGQPSRSSATPPTWSADSLTDTIRLSFFRGFGGDEFAFALPPGFPDTLHGRVTEITDYAPPRRLGVAHAVRVACPT